MSFYRSRIRASSHPFSIWLLRESLFATQYDEALCWPKHVALRSSRERASHVFIAGGMHMP